jgi:hypothetical protein
MASKMTCKNSPKNTYTGKEMSPLGVGFCADAEKVGVKMTGNDGKEWVVGLNKGNKLWIRTKDEPKKKPEPKTPEPQSEVEKEDDEDDEEEDKDDEEDEEDKDDVEEEKPKEEPKAKPKEKAEPKPKAKKAPKEDTESSEEEKPKAKGKSKNMTEQLNKLLSTLNIQGKAEERAAEEIKALFAKKFKKDNEDKPKRAPSKYNKYVSIKLTELRNDAELHKKHPDLKAKDYMALAGAAWKLLSDEEKEAYA